MGTLDAGDVLNRMRYDDQGYFRAYYRELRRHIC